MKHRALSLLAFVVITACGTSKSDVSSEEFEKAVASNEKLADEVEALRDQRSDISGQLDTNNQKVEDLQKQVDRLNTDGDAAQTKYQSDLDSKTKELTTTQAELAALKVKLENAPTPEQQKAAQDQITTLTAKSKVQDQNIADMKKLVVSAQQSQKAAAAELAAQIVKAKTVYDAQVTKLNQMETANAKMTKDLAAQQEANRKLQDQATALQAKNGELQKNMDAANARIKQLEACLQTLQGRYAELNEKYGQVMGDLGQTKIQLGAAQASNAALQAELTAAKLKNQQLESKNSALEAQLKQAQADAAAARAAATKAQQEAAAAKQQAAAAQAAAAQAKADAAAAAAKAAAAQQAAAATPKAG